MVNSLLEEKSEIPFIIIASVSVGGVFLLIINIVLLHCFIQKRKAENAKDNISVGMSKVFLQWKCNRFWMGLLCNAY